MGSNDIIGFLKTHFLTQVNRVGLIVLQGMPRVTTKKTKPTLEKNATFDLRAFLDTSGAARRIEKFRRFERIYSQGDPPGA
jgi:hypothetical protein